MKLLLTSLPYFVQPTHECHKFVKKKVFDAAVMSSLLYGSESWLTNSIKGIEKQYSKLMKCLLGVRKNTSVNLCMLEAGIPPLDYILEKKKRIFLMSRRDRTDEDEPFTFVFD